MEIDVQTTPDTENVTQSVHGTAGVLSLAGEIDLGEAPAVTALGEQAIADPVLASVVVDLGGVTFLDSTGLGALVGLHRRAEAAGKPLALRRITPPVAKVLRLTGLVDVFAVDDGPVAG